MRTYRASDRVFAGSAAVATACACCAIALVGGDANAQPPRPCTGKVDVHVVTADSHQPVIGAAVTVDGAEPAATDETGHFVVHGLCPGDHAIVVEQIGFELDRATVAVRERQTTSLELKLEPLTAGEVIRIEADHPVEVDTRSTATVSGEALERTRGRSFSDALAEVPGVSQLRSASGLAKPIVRGHYGRRLLILVDGVRHRSQSWGIDHAPEIDPFIADRLRVVRGAAGVRFGPDAIGGAILVDPPPLRRKPGTDAELHLMGFDSRGAGVAARLSSATARWPGLAWQVEGSGKRLAAASTPDYALANTGSSEWNLGATAGYRRERDNFKLSFRHYQAELGVCFCLRVESSEDFFSQQQGREPLGADTFSADFAIDRPRQTVSHDLALAHADFRLRDIGTVSTTYAFQRDQRREFDTVRNATGPQFSFLLSSHDLDARLEHKPLHISPHLHLRGAAGAVGLLQTHQYAGLPLVPDHTASAAGLWVAERLLGHDFEIDAGVRYDLTRRAATFDRNDFLRLVRGDQIAESACSDPTADRIRCDSTFHTLSASVGGLYQLSVPWSVKLNLSTASRPPNPDEQYLSGTSPTFPVLGLGKPDLSPETTYAASLTTTYDSETIRAEASVYSNYTAGYIEFAPALDDAGQPIFDVLVRGSFPRFVTRPVDALFYGTDAGAAVRPVPALELGGHISMVRARSVTDDRFLVFVPPDRVRGTARYTHQPSVDEGSLFVELGTTYVARQNRFDINADLAPPPQPYLLFDAEAGGATELYGRTVKITVAATNLLGERYRDYTSLLRYFADQPGAQVLVRLSVLQKSSRH